MWLECSKDCRRSKKDPRFTCETTVTLNHDFTVFNRDFVDVDPKKIFCAYCNAPARVCRHPEMSAACPVCGAVWLDSDDAAECCHDQRQKDEEE